VTWECIECNAEDRRNFRIDGVCHHCGKPLCRDDQVLIADDAFATSSEGASQVAVHCRTCRRRYHPKRVRLGSERQ
jgi:hypothetical protein